MKFKCYLIISANGAMRTTKSPPHLHQSEVAIKLDVDISNKFFERYIPSGKLVVGDEHVIRPEIEVVLDLPEDSEYGEAVIKSGKDKKL